MNSMQNYSRRMMSGEDGDYGSEFLDPNGLAWAIPESISQAMAGYAANPNSLSARNTAWQAFYAEQPKAAGQAAGQAEGYNGLLGAINNAYGITPEWMEAATLWSKMSDDEREAYLNQQNGNEEEQGQQGRLMNGLLSPKPHNNQSTLAILWR